MAEIECYMCHAVLEPIETEEGLMCPSCKALLPLKSSESKSESTVSKVDEVCHPPGFGSERARSVRRRVGWGS